MVGSIKGFVSLVKQENPNVTSAHCFLHGKMLISKSLGGELKKFLMMLQKWSTLLNKDQFTPRIFKRLCENLDKEHINLLLHTEIWWLSRGRVINRVFELKDGL